MNTAVNVTDISRWMVDRLAASDGCRTPVYRLHNDFALWALGNNSAFVRLDVFEAQLRSEGATLEGHMVRGFCLRADLPREEEPISEDGAPLQKGSITAAQLLEDLLTPGPQSTQDIRAASALAAFAWSTMLMAKSRLGVQSHIAGIWELPRKEDHEDLRASWQDRASDRTQQKADHR